ncbi:MAG: ribose-phosphate pyrophosphokinase, partial [Clostridia bacterium]|nr:ribose-phosphate pyrophosphokinase [Clostridia bacterium]
ANRIFIFSTFGLFVEGYDKFDEYYENGYIDKIFTTNLIYNEPELLEKPWYCNVNMSKYIALLIDTLNCDNSISKFLDPADRINKIMEKYNQR